MSQISHHNTVCIVLFVCIAFLVLDWKCLIKLLMKWTQFISNYQKSTLGGPRKKQFVLQSCFYVLPRHTNLIWDKGFILFDECASRCVNLSPPDQECTSSTWWNTKMYTSGTIASSPRILTEIKESGTIAKTRISVESDTVKHLKAFTIISGEMSISLPVLS